MSEALRKAAEQAIDALECGPDNWTSKQAIRSIRAALAEPEQSEPVAWMDADGNFSDNNDYGAFPIPLFTAQPRREPLTRKQVRQILESTGYGVANPLSKADFVNGIRHAEAAHGIGVKP